MGRYMKGQINYPSLGSMVNFFYSITLRIFVALLLQNITRFPNPYRILTLGEAWKATALDRL
jgi:hypothetical protein